MSSFNKSVLLGSLLFTLISCQKSDSGTSAVDKEGNCKQETIDTYNNVSSSYYLKSASELQSSCQSYKNLIGSQTCMAVNVKTGLTTSINSTSLDNVCERKVSTNITKPIPSQPASPNRKNEDENCRQETIDAYNDITSSYYLKSPAELQSSCQSFKKLTSSKTCMAVNIKTGQSTPISFYSLDSICERKNSTTNTPSQPESQIRRNESLYSNNYCSDKVIASYNQMITSGQKFVSSRSENDLQNLITECISFKELTNKKECSAVNSYSEKIVISYDKFKSVCDNLQPLQPTQDTSAEISTLKQGIKITITNAQKMNLLLQKGKYVKGGRIGSKKLIDATGTCRVEKKSPQILFQNRQTVIFSGAQNVQNATIIDDSRSPFSIVCIRKNFTKGTTLRDLENSFGNIIDVKINE